MISKARLSLFTIRKFSNQRFIANSRKKEFKQVSPINYCRRYRFRSTYYIVVNRLRGSLKIAAVKAPGFGDRRKEMLEDIAVLTGGGYFRRKGLSLENADLKC